MKLISVVLPTLNSSNFIGHAIENILDQTYQNLELIVVDGGSIDTTLEIVSGFKDPRIKIFMQENNDGQLPGALNIGFSKTIGEYLTWAQDDDYFESNTFEILANFLEQKQSIDFVYTDYWLVNSYKEKIRRIKVHPPEDLVNGNCVGHCFLFRRRVYDHVGNQNTDEFYLVHDYEYWIRVSQRFRMAICKLETPIYFHTMHSQNLSSRYYFDVAIDLDRARVKYFNVEPTPLNKIIATRYIELGFEAYREGKLNEVRSNFVNGIMKDTSFIKNRGVLSILLESFVGEKISNTIRRIL